MRPMCGNRSKSSTPCMRQLWRKKDFVTNCFWRSGQVENNLSRIRAVIKKRRMKAIEINEWISLLGRIAFVAAVLLILFSQVFLLCRLNGNSMFPALKDGDLLIGFRLHKDYGKDDVVLFRMDGKTCAARIAATEGDVVSLDDSGQLYVNGAIQAGDIMFPTNAKEGIEYPYEVPEGHVFLLGDYRTRATDSRDFGAVPVEEIEAKLISILRRRGL